MANFNTTYETEREGQMEFFDNYGIPYNDDASVLVDNTDGVYNGNIFEFKLNISNLNKTLFQAIKYLSKMRVKGESVPATILLVDLNATTVYVYKSQDYFDAIHKIYTGVASKDNEGFVAGNYDLMLDYSDMAQSAQMKKILKRRKVNPDEMYMPIDIDENCIVGWAERYYKEKPKASKGDFLGDDTGTAVKVTGEIRDPRHFKGLINPYTGKSNEKFKYLMDCLNDRLSKKDLGAFYTPIQYAKKAAELVQMAVDRVPDGNDYIILDRCAGTGNLEAALIGLKDKNGEDLIEHCVVSTYEYYEYKVLSERIGDKVRDIIPPSEANVVYENGKVANADAVSKEFIENPIIRQYIDNPKCTIIMFENPPYSEASTVQANGQSKNYRAAWKNSYAINEMKKEVSGTASNDLANLFIWTAFHIYIRQPNDCYIVFSPLKYWRYQHLVNKKYYGGYIFNRAHFHASPSAITCCRWGFEESDYDDPQISIGFKIYDITYDKLSPEGDLVSVSTFGMYDQLETKLHNDMFWISRVHHLISEIYDKRRFPLDRNGIVCGKNGYEDLSKNIRGVPLYNENIIGYIISKAFGFENPRLKTSLTRIQMYDANGFYLRDDNYMKMLPIFVAGKYPVEEVWYRNGIVCTTSDGGDKYAQDNTFLMSCLLYTCLSYYNKCLSFDGSDGRRYQNELCFDDSRTDKPLALQDLEKHETLFGDAFDDDEKMLLKVWCQILTEARKTDKYNPEFNYGIYQITKELNSSHVIGTGKSKKTVYDYPVLNGHLDALRAMLKEYYKTHIAEKMFKYELLK